MVMPTWPVGTGACVLTAGRRPENRRNNVVSCILPVVLRILTDTGAVGTWQNDRDRIKAASGLPAVFDVRGAPRGQNQSEK